MRRLSYGLLAVLFALFLFGAEATLPHAGTQADPDVIYSTPTVALAFNDAYTSVPVTIARIDAELLTEAGVPVTTWTFTSGWTVADGLFKMPIRTQAAALANGVYQMRVRVWDTAGNVSEWCQPYWVSKRWRVVDPPGGCRTIP